MQKAILTQAAEGAATSITDSSDATEIDHRSQAEILASRLSEAEHRNAQLEAHNRSLVDAIAARDSFLAVVAHELRNPMTPILGRVTLLKRSLDRGETSIADASMKLQQIEKLVVKFIRRATMLLDVSRASSGRLYVGRGPVDATDVIGEVVAELAAVAIHAGSTLSVELPDHRLTIVGDRLALEQVLDNLISNAVKYGEGKPIRVSAAIDDTRGRIVIKVRDGGPGISASACERIFERFERAVADDSSITGFGVGLWIVRQLCEAMSGDVRVESIVGHGSTFLVDLPLHKPEIQNEQSP